MLKDIWEKQPPGFYSLSYKTSKGQWQDKFFNSIKAALRWLKDNSDIGDLYFCTTTLSDERRIKGCVQPSKYLWQDLDEVDPGSLGDLRPTIAWESSPGRYQALWELDEICETDRLEKLNKDLAYTVEADQGSWILTKVLRIPGTTNNKYPKKPTVKLLWDDGNTFKIRRLERLTRRNEDEREVEISGLDPKKIYQKYRKRIPGKVRRLLTSDTAVKGKRSDTLWYLEHELIKAGLKPDEVIVLVKNSVWNKFRGRSDEDDRLTTELRKILDESSDRVLPILSGDGEPEDDEDDSSEPLFSMRIDNDYDLMTDLSQYPSWMVEGFWTRKSHGIVAGEPKSFKSTLVLDMGVSIASGKKFLGEFNVIDSGPVLVVQNENAPWIMKDRLIKMRANKGLIGSVEKIKGLWEVSFPKSLPMYYINQQGFSLTEPIHRKLLDKAMSSIQPVLVIMDPLYLMFDGDVNQSKELNPVLNWLLSLKDKHNCALCLIHHWKKGTQGSKLRGGQRMLGSTTLHGWIESAWYLDVQKSDDLEEEITDDEELNAPGGSAILTLEREFRGSGNYPKLDLSINMGDFGSPDYSVIIQKHKKERHRVSEFEVKKALEELLELRGGHITVREASKELGVSRKIVSKILDDIKGDKNDNS